ncbi:ribulose bisphosphate carboxylaseoxygenase large subunit [Pullulanibacillus camelliae]|uniref:Ribulose bisphosphate carboxylaseoxygenase large subunit n=1 Tax=Pullulanibacillus camelliae TaxID=1707096 RepID=A0A8J3DY62_9BACL|nr:ribulose-bisphosphate carboxylase large subunit family protein [Pullulanibacillus camelliae]GGE52823.1 ribulose bisphosphate carboxylaseoxygenase large subunit [Pullulanibacillus camelliae]
MNEDRLLATYLVETPYSLNYAAEKIAGEQSTGTFVTVPGETHALKERHRAQIVKVTPLEDVTHPSLPGGKIPSHHDGVYHRGEVVIAFPVCNFGISLPNILATVAGNLFELQELTGIRLIDLEFPRGFSEGYKGPRYGVAGTRKLIGVYRRPIIGTIIKPSVGLTLEALQQLVYELATSGLDFIKDDELNANPPYAPLEKKVKAVMEAIHRAADKTGKKVMYAFNITGDIDQLRAHHDCVVSAGGNCVMVSINSIGLSGLSYLSRFSEVPIHGHRNQWGMYTRAPFLGMDFNVYQKLCRLAGADHLHVNGLNSKFYESNASVVHSIQSTLKPFLGGYETMPVISSGQWAGTVQETYSNIKSIDVMHLAGGGILAHPNGVAAGCESMKYAWEAATQGIELHHYAEKYPVLQAAIDHFSTK